MQPAYDRRDCCELIIYSLKKYLLLPIIRQKRACPVFLARNYEPGGGGSGGGAPVQSDNNAGETTLQASARNYEPDGGSSGGGAPIRSDNNAGEFTLQVQARHYEPCVRDGRRGAPVQSDNNAGETTLQVPGGGGGGGGSGGGAHVRTDNNAGETTLQVPAFPVFLARNYGPGGGGSGGGAPVQSDNNAKKMTVRVLAIDYKPCVRDVGPGAHVRSDNNVGETTLQAPAHNYEPGGGGNRGGAPVRSDNNAVEFTLQGPDHQQDLIKQRDQSFRSIQDLKAAGINLKPSKSCSLKDIKFSSMGLGFVGELVLPPLMVDDSMAPKFMNLIAYEMCPDNMETNYEVTSYICFLDSLIDYAADVKELRTAGILRNILGSDKQVAKLFNEIATDLVPNNEVYKKVINDIERHYKNKWTTWMAQVCSEHFSTPWTILAFLAAVLVLFMTAVQTWFTVYPPPGPCDEFCRKL